MSHKVTIKTQFKELQPLLKAFQILGWSIEHNAVARGWNDGAVHEVVARNTVQDNSRDNWASQDLVVERDEKNRVYQVHNSMDSDVVEIALESLGGREMPRLKRQYGIETIKNRAKQKGAECTVTEHANGKTHVLVTYA